MKNILENMVNGMYNLGVKGIILTKKTNPEIIK
jgi:hypothetical protein